MEGFSEVLQLLHEMEMKLTAAIATGLATVNTSITALAERHNSALLEQERKNASFADRERVESVARNVHDARNEVTGLLLRVGKCEQAEQKLQAALDALAEQVDTRSLKMLSGANGYLVSLLVVFISVVLTYVLTHVH